MNSLDDSLWVNHPMSSRNKLLCTFIFYSLLKLTSPIVWYLLEGPERHVLTQKRPHAKHEILSSPSDICEKAQRSSLSWDWVVSSAVCLSFRLSHIFQAQFWWKTCSNYGSKVDSVDIWWWRLCCHVTVSLQKHISGKFFTQPLTAEQRKNLSEVWKLIHGVLWVSSPVWFKGITKTELWSHVCLHIQGDRESWFTVCLWRFPTHWRNDPGSKEWGNADRASKYGNTTTRDAGSHFLPISDTGRDIGASLTTTQWLSQCASA